MNENVIVDKNHPDAKKIKVDCDDCRGTGYKCGYCNGKGYEVFYVDKSKIEGDFDEG